MARLLQAACAAVTRFFAVWITAAALAGLRFPGLFSWALPRVSLLLGVIMFGMGLTLSGDDFRLVMRRPWYVAAGAAVGMGEPQRRAVGIEVGMQNSGLAVALALAHFAPSAAVAGALFSVWQNLSGAALAAAWARRDARAGR